MNRRGFLGNAGKALAGIVAAPVVARAGVVETPVQPDSPLDEFVAQVAEQHAVEDHYKGMHTHTYDKTDSLWGYPIEMSDDLETPTDIVLGDFSEYIT